MGKTVEELEAELASLKAKKEKEEKTELNEGKKEATTKTQNSGVKKGNSLLDSMKSRVQEYKEDAKKREEARKSEEEKKIERTYVGKKSLDGKKETTRTVFNFIPLSSKVAKGNTCEAVRIVTGGFSIIFDTGVKSETGKGTKKEIFNISSFKDFLQFEKNFDVSVLSKADEDLVRNVMSLIWTLKEYFPYFDNVINTNPKNLPSEYMAKYGGRLRINYYPNYMLIPCILLSQEIISNNGESETKINKYSMLHFNKSKLIEDWINHIEEWENSAGEHFAKEFNELFNGPDDDMTFSKYLSITIDDDEEMKKNTPNAINIPNRIVEFKINNYDPREFKPKSGDALVITQELLNKVPDIYDMEEFFRVSTFDRKVYERLESILLEARSWLAEHAVMVNIDSNNSSQNEDHENKVETSTETESKSDSTIDEDDVPF